MGPSPQIPTKLVFGVLNVPHHGPGRRVGLQLVARISLMSSSRSSGKGCDPSPNESNSWSLSPHGEVRAQILAFIAAALDSGRVHGASRPSEGFPPPSLRGRCLKAMRYITLSERFGLCVIGRVVGRSEISMQWRAHGSGGRVPPRSSTVPPAGCVGVRTSRLSEAETGSEPKVSPANACWPAFSLRDWRLLSPGVLRDGSLCRLGGVVGFAWGTVPPGLSASRTGPALQRMAATRPCIICSGYRLRSLELRAPWLHRRSCQW